MGPWSYTHTNLPYFFGLNHLFTSPHMDGPVILHAHISPLFLWLKPSFYFTPYGLARDLTRTQISPISLAYTIFLLHRIWMGPWSYTHTNLPYFFGLNHLFTSPHMDWPVILHAHKSPLFLWLIPSFYSAKYGWARDHTHTQTSPISLA